MKDRDSCEGGIEKPGILSCSMAEMLDTLGMCWFFAATGTIASIFTGIIAPALVTTAVAVTAATAVAGVACYLASTYIKRKIDNTGADIAERKAGVPGQLQSRVIETESVYAPSTPRLQPDRKPTLRV